MKEYCNVVAYGPESAKDATEFAGAPWYSWYYNEKIEPWDGICIKEKDHEGLHDYKMVKRSVHPKRYPECVEEGCILHPYVL